MIRTGVIIIVLAIVAILSWRFRQTETLDPAASVEPAHQSDFFLENFRLRQYGETGRLHYRIDGLRLEHFPDEDNTLISQPSMVLHNDRGPTWRITAAKAEAGSEELDEVRFSGNVEITGDNADNRSPLHVATAGLLLKPKAEFAQSEGSVTFTRPGARLVAESLKADLKLGQFELHNVQGRYEP